jgi:hypothetical protein
MNKELIDQLLKCLQELEGLWLDYTEACELKAMEIKLELAKN